MRWSSGKASQQLATPTIRKHHVSAEHFMTSRNRSSWAAILVTAGAIATPSWTTAQSNRGSHDDARAACDVVVYGGTSAGVTAAVQAAALGRSVVLIEPGTHIGGLTSGGLGATDIGNKAAIGGLSRKFYQLLWQHYAEDTAWTWQQRSEYRSGRQRQTDKAMWTFEPHVAEQVLRAMLAAREVPIVLGERLDLSGGVAMDGTRITSIRMESGRVFRGKMFVDATYEGDLMAKAGVSYTVGREANSDYDETLNGVQVKNAVHHQFVVPVDPYLVPGDASSGLLPGITAGPLPTDGTGDHRVQAYCFRMCITDVAANRAPWIKPRDYDEPLYELLFRNFEAGDMRIPWNPIWMPNRKTDTNNNFAVSTDFIGSNYDWANADYATRATIFDRHLSYQQGLLWSLAHHPRVPKKIREHFQRFGPAKDEFVAHGNWPHQLYVREARRMVSDYVMTQHDCQGRRQVEDAVGLAAYTMDSHHVQRYVDEHGHVRNEGDVQIGGFPPYPISYRSIRPKKSECENLLVPACLSASHMAYGSIRMEPVFMVLGQSAATAAVQAIEAGVAVQDIDVEELQRRLVEDGQVLQWTQTRSKPGIDVKSLKGIVLDDKDAQLTGAWTTSHSAAGYVGIGYRHDGNVAKGHKAAEFLPDLPKAATYEIRIAYTPHSNRASNAKVTIKHADGTVAVFVNQQQPPNRGTFQAIGSYRCVAGQQTSVTISNEGSDGYVIVDAVQFVPAR
tara:strand:+ start:36502 stop:38694 length:2193 start_codon:yes stop_codon:yes gene_type:complete